MRSKKYQRPKIKVKSCLEIKSLKMFESSIPTPKLKVSFEISAGCVRIIMLPSEDAAATCFAKAKDANGNLQPTICM